VGLIPRCLDISGSVDGKLQELTLGCFGQAYWDAVGMTLGCCGDDTGMLSGMTLGCCGDDTGMLWASILGYFRG